MKEMENRMAQMEEKMATAVLERNLMAEKIAGMDVKNRQVNENVQKIEGEVASGMEKAKEEVKDELRDEMKERENRKESVNRKKSGRIAKRGRIGK